jgi:hypothetical protein
LNLVTNGLNGYNREVECIDERSVQEVGLDNGTKGNIQQEDDDDNNKRSLFLGESAT